MNQKSQNIWFHGVQEYLCLRHHHRSLEFCLICSYSTCGWSLICWQWLWDVRWLSDVCVVQQQSVSNANHTRWANYNLLISRVQHKPSQSKHTHGQPNFTTDLPYTWNSLLEWKRRFQMLPNSFRLDPRLAWHFCRLLERFAFVLQIVLTFLWTGLVQSCKFFLDVCWSTKKMHCSDVACSVFSYCKSREVYYWNRWNCSQKLLRNV